MHGSSSLRSRATEKPGGNRRLFNTLSFRVHPQKGTESMHDLVLWPLKLINPWIFPLPFATEILLVLGLTAWKWSHYFEGLNALLNTLTPAWVLIVGRCYSFGYFILPCFFRYFGIKKHINFLLFWNRQFHGTKMAWANRCFNVGQNGKLGNIFLAHIRQHFVLSSSRCYPIFALGRN